MIMDEKSIRILEYFKILELVGGYCEFPVSEEKALNVRPTGDIIEARRLLAETREAVEVLANHTEISIGGARDIRSDIDLAVSKRTTGYQIHIDLSPQTGSYV